MKAIKDIQKRYCSQALIIAIVVALVSIILGEKSVGKGFLLGTIFSIINFIILGQLIPLRLAKSRSMASVLAFISIFLRLVILAIPLIISLKADVVDFIGVVIGLFMVQLTILFNLLR